MGDRHRNIWKINYEKEWILEIFDISQKILYFEWSFGLKSDLETSG
jgi:hypothetical protein